MGWARPGVFFYRAQGVFIQGTRILGIRLKVFFIGHSRVFSSTATVPPQKTQTVIQLAVESVRDLTEGVPLGGQNIVVVLH